ncbi:GTP diphosphokinase [Synergistales bacterium]|nr:GTP diphosphokinase [Synergistales bacterium]
MTDPAVTPAKSLTQSLTSSILNSVPSIESNDESKEMAHIRDDFYSQLPEPCKTESVKTAWQSLWSKTFIYLSPSQMNQLGKAFIYAARGHEHQKRTSGEPYILHTVNVAVILAEMQLDLSTLCAALLHDVIEDTEVTVVELSAIFGEEIVNLVDGVTKLGKVPFMSAEGYQAENIRKMFVSMVRDIRVVLIKLADRLHNMRTLAVLRRDKQERIARETLEIFAPIAHRLGIYQIKKDLEDLSFKYLQPEIYNDIRRKVRRKLPEREEIIQKGIAALEERLAQEKIPCKIKGRAKNFYSIYEKMERKKLSIDELYDLLAIRVLVSDVTACYSALGIVHSMWTPIPQQFDDYIANPKNNMYQSLHTTVMAFGAPMEVQIRTKEMNQLAEYGIAAHWRYKSGGGGGGADSFDAKLNWVRQALEGEQEGRDPEEFLEMLKSDILTSEVYCFTPKGKAVVLPKGATTIDFAYAVHTEVGNRCVGAMIQNRIVPLNTEVKNGDIVKIITSPQGAPSRDWIKFAKSTRTRSKIRNYYRQIEKTNRDEKITRGREALERELKKRGIATYDAEEFTPILNKIARDTGLSSGDDLLLAVGGGSPGPSVVAQKLAYALLQQKQPDENGILTPDKKPHLPKHQQMDVIVDGFEGVMVVLANCCAPVPGDEIIGCTTRTRGITVHRQNCPSVQNVDKERLIDVSWNNGPNSGKFYTARIKVEATDRGDLVRDIAQVISQGSGSIQGGGIQGMKVSIIDNTLARMRFDLRVKNLEHLYEITGKINGVRGVIEVERG